MENNLYQLNDGNEESMGLVNTDLSYNDLETFWIEYYHDCGTFEVDELSVDEFIEQMNDKGYTINRVYYEIVNT